MLLATYIKSTNLPIASLSLSLSLSRRLSGSISGAHYHAWTPNPLLNPPPRHTGMLSIIRDIIHMVVYDSY